MMKILKRAGIVFVFAFMALVVYRGIFYVIPKERTDAQVEKIHSTRLSLVDVMGKNLPPVPQNPDATIVGVDANKNGIRDDVELAIFKEYPNSAKTRAVLLQYALALQMEVTQSIINSETVGAVSNVEDGAFFCITKIVLGSDKQENMVAIKKYEDFVLARQLNTEARKKARDDFYTHLSSGSVEDSGCDVDITSLPN